MQCSIDIYNDHEHVMSLNFVYQYNLLISWEYIVELNGNDGA